MHFAETAAYRMELQRQIFEDGTKTVISELGLAGHMHVIIDDYSAGRSFTTSRGHL